MIAIILVFFLILIIVGVVLGLYFGGIIGGKLVGQDCQEDKNCRGDDNKCLNEKCVLNDVKKDEKCDEHRLCATGLECVSKKCKESSPTESSSPSPSPTESPSPSPTESPSPTPEVLNEVKSGDVITVKNLGRQHFDGEDRFLRGSSDGDFGLGTDVGCTSNVCQFMIVKIDPINNVVIKDSVPIELGDIIKIYSLSRMEPIISETGFDIVQIRPASDYCSIFPEEACLVADQWKVKSDNSSGVVKYGDSLYFQHINHERKSENTGFLDLDIDGFGPGPTLDRSNPIRYQMWILSKVEGDNIAATELLERL